MEFFLEKTSRNAFKQFIDRWYCNGHQKSGTNLMIKYMLGLKYTFKC